VRPTSIIPKTCQTISATATARGRVELELGAIVAVTIGSDVVHAAIGEV